LVNYAIPNPNTIDTSIVSIVRTGAAAPSNAITISAPDSDVIVKAWAVGNRVKTVYYTTLADVIYFNEDSSYMFSNMRGLTSTDLFDNVISSSIVNAEYMFNNCIKLRET
jgi:hypothetical protein